MKILMLVAADYAAVEPKTRKLNMIGVFRNIGASKFPVAHSRFYVVMQIEGNITDRTSQHGLRVTVSDPECTVLLSFEGAIELRASQDSILDTCNVIAEINGLELTKAGEYEIRAVLDDGEVEGSTIIRAIRRES